MKLNLFFMTLCLFLSACYCDPDDAECNAWNTGQPIQISDSDGIKLFKKYDEGEWIYYSVDAKKVTWTTQYQCGLILVGKVATPIYCNKDHQTLGVK